MRLISHHEIEQGLTGDGMGAVVVHEFGMGDLISPETRVGPTKDPKVQYVSTSWLTRSVSPLD